MKAPSWLMMLIIIACDPCHGYADPYYETKVSDVSTELAVPGRDGESVTVYSESHALLIGEVNYEGGYRPLVEIPGEIKDLTTALERHRFKVKVYFDLRAGELVSVIDKFMRTYGSRPDARIIVYLSGHGYTRNSFTPPIGYFLPVDAAKSGPPHQIAASAIPLDYFSAWARVPDARHILFVFDACFSGAFFGYYDDAAPVLAMRNDPSAPAPPRTFGIESNDFAISPVPLKPGRQFISAGQAGQRVPEKSLLTRLLINMLNDKNTKALTTFSRWITAEDMGFWLQKNGELYAASIGQGGLAPRPIYGRLPGEQKYQQGNMVFDRIPLDPAVETAWSQLSDEPFQTITIVARSQTASLGVDADANESFGSRDRSVVLIQPSGESLSTTANPVADEGIGQAQISVAVHDQAARTAAKLADRRTAALRQAAAEANTPENHSLSLQQELEFAAMIERLSSDKDDVRQQASSTLGTMIGSLAPPIRPAVVDRLMYRFNEKSTSYQRGVALALSSLDAPIIATDATAIIQALDIAGKGYDPHLRRYARAAKEKF
ncbi:caspase family protein [Neorhizobium sp. T786]|uniref:caspase family protein n=1 Tax=Pseudorhizobium xiangyangii TaxID=2883104 RepID=UPI001CFF5F6F|nr:caspase family protein [Neorhizobium xiangyangii]MCB5205120.1 caspase family protein [Neorhizobium xiangyangii]